MRSVDIEIIQKAQEDLSAMPFAANPQTGKLPYIKSAKMKLKVAKCLCVLAIGSTNKG